MPAVIEGVRECDTNNPPSDYVTAPAVAYRWISASIYDGIWPR